MFVIIGSSDNVDQKSHNILSMKAVSPLQQGAMAVTILPDPMGDRLRMPCRVPIRVTTPKKQGMSKLMKSAKPLLLISSPHHSLSAERGNLRREEAAAYVYVISRYSIRTRAYAGCPPWRRSRLKNSRRVLGPYVVKCGFGLFR